MSIRQDERQAQNWLERLVSEPEACLVLKERSGDCRVVRVRDTDGNSAIVKLWNRPGVAGMLRRLTGTGSMTREKQALERLAAAGLRVPKVLGFERLESAELPFTDALVLEDLGECVTALEHAKALSRLQKDAELARFLGQVVDLTVGMLEAGISDRDHSFNNVVATSGGDAARLDLEIARADTSDRAIGDMLGRLLATLVFALQPDVEPVTRFASALRERISPSARALARARAKMEEMLAVQWRDRGIQTRVELPW